MVDSGGQHTVFLVKDGAPSAASGSVAVGANGNGH
jgi:hypothetical protein